MPTQSLLSWSTDFSIGHDKTDAQHQQLFKLLGLVHKAARSKEGDTQNMIEKSLRVLLEYTQVHFNDEENFMQDISYPHYEEHRQLHDGLIHQVENMVEELQEGELVLVDELLLFLNDWLSEHILTQDTKIGNYIRQL